MRSFTVAVLILLVPTTGSARADGVEFFEAKIRPLLVEKCYKCHSAGSEKLKGDLRVDTRAALLQGGESKQPAVIPGDPEHSPLIIAVRFADEDLQMPPKHKLTDGQIADLVAWVKMGAPDPRSDATSQISASDPRKKHWAFQPLSDPPVPDGEIGGRTEIDRFVNAKLDANGISPLGAAEKRALIRRATYDLCGLPPSVDQVEAFLADPSPDAFAKVVDRLLGCPQYGERWGRHWLDLVRYADTAGESADFPVPQAYLYRNYVIDSFNHDKPYDQFLKEQIAGDLMSASNEAEREEHLIATGFLAISKRFGVDPEHQMHLTIDDTIDTLGKSMLGLSLNCCRCHDHKFDPLTSKDYYALYGFFASTRFPFPGSEERKYQKDFAALAPPEKAAPALSVYEAKFEALEKDYSWVKKLYDESKKTGKAKEKQWEVMDEARKKIAALTAVGPGFGTAYAVADEAPRDVYVMKRGEPANRGELAPRAFPVILGGQTLKTGGKASGRLELAGWITNTANPLTARVIVNRIWQHHFGKGLITSPSDFGTRGSPPTHPELLDYLARRMIDSHWSIKSMHRLIMLTDAYQRAASDDTEAAATDPGNAYLWRFDRRRLDAEEIRDAILSVSGALDRSPGKEHPFPSKTDWTYTQHAPFSAMYETSRRSVYLMQQRIKRHPFLALFDGADPSATTASRAISTTPLQSLYVMNDPFVFAESEHFAVRLLGVGSDAAIRAAYLECYSRPATDDEVAAGCTYLMRYTEKLTAAAVEPKDRHKMALAAYFRMIFASNEFFFVD